MRLYLKSFFAAAGFWLFWVYLVPCYIFRTQRWTFSLSTAASTSGRPGSVSLNHLHTTTSMTWTGDGLIHLKERKEHAVIQPSTAGADRTSTAPQLTVDPHLFHSIRTELLKLLLTCFSEAMYLPPSSDRKSTNPWVSFFCSSENR